MLPRRKRDIPRIGKWRLRVLDSSTQHDHRPEGREQHRETGPGDADIPTANAGCGLTVELAGRALEVRHDGLPSDARRLALDCLTDWLGCAIAGTREPASRIVTDCMLDEGGAPQASLVGQGIKASMPQAALVNGTASHVLDYDDVNLALPGHASVAIVPGLLALAEHRKAPISDFIAAFVAGYETTCRIGKLVSPAHYASGFHATATIGSLGAAMACAHLLSLPLEQSCFALGLAATQAAGLKAMFGSMAKPLHAGMAAQAGLRSALLAQKGFVSRGDALECFQGFAHAHGDDFHPDRALAEPDGGYYILANLFKFHASCFSTHSAIEAMTRLRREHRLTPGSISGIRILAGAECTICNIQSPSTPLETKFSLKTAAALALLGRDTSRLETWDEAAKEDVQAIARNIRVELQPGMGLSKSTVFVAAADGRSLEQTIDCNIPAGDKAAQSRRVADKFSAIAAPVIGARQCGDILRRIASNTHDWTMPDLMRHCGPARR